MPMVDIHISLEQQVPRFMLIKSQTERHLPVSGTYHTVDNL